MKKVITVFGSGREAEISEGYKFAYTLGKLLGENGYSLCNGGYAGIMEAAAKGASETGADTIGIICELFYPFPNKYIKQYEIKKTLFERLNRLIDLGDAYVILKGGTGTLLELAAVWELINKNIIIGKPIIAVSPFWEPLINQFKKELAGEGKGVCAEYIDLAKTPEEIISILNSKL